MADIRIGVVGVGKMGEYHVGILSEMRDVTLATELTERPQFREALSDVTQALRSGKSFADSLGTRPEYFSDLYLNMIRAGEVSA